MAMQNMLSESVLLACAQFLDPRSALSLTMCSLSLRAAVQQLDMLWSMLLMQPPFEYCPNTLSHLQQQQQQQQQQMQIQQPMQQQRQSLCQEQAKEQILYRLYKQLAEVTMQLQQLPSNDVDLPLQVLFQHPKARGLVLQSLRCVARACEEDYNRLVACGKDAHVVVHNILRSFAFDEEVQNRGLRALVLLCRPIGAPEGSIVRRHPSTPWAASPTLGDVVIDAIKNHDKSPTVLCNAAWASSNIALSHKQWLWLVEHNINELLLSVLEQYPTDERLQLRGLSAFINVLRPEADLTRVAQVACAAHEMCKDPSSKISERAVWVLYIISKWRPNPLRIQRVRQCAVDVLLQDRHLVTFATSLASSVLRHVFNEEPLTLIARLEPYEEDVTHAPPTLSQRTRLSTLTTMAT